MTQSPAPRPRRGRQRDPQAHADVLRATRELLAELGFHKVTMERISERAGVARMTLYRWWPNKAAVVTEAVADQLGPGPLPDTGSVREDVLTQLADLVAALTLLGDPSVVAAALTERGEPGRADLRDVVAARSEPGALLLRRGIERGELPADLPIETVVDSWLGFILYRIVFMQREPTPTELTDLVNLLPFTPPPPAP
ncbi:MULTISPECIES: TetR/AcrR family transcriptional regulator [unclassified Streptomyces]|uniref:TetR/AcrR family transcriptional regulator n=1 Tax=unclassified Streptomyces TaxID=2593676 RepID=UPI0004BF856D|nr:MULTISPECIES: TetR/AcrR family transcriptional regulator [unclassified Streptomyces]